MKLIYKILWIEDQMNSIRGKKRVISNYIKDEKGFELEINEILTFEQFKETVGFESLKDYDLVLVDLNLDDDESGDGNKIIEEIRNNDIYTEIIFYSSHYAHLIDLLKENRTEGIFTSERNQIDTKAKKIIDVTLHKIQDVNNLRGLIMAEVAELERIKERIIIKASPKISEKNIEKYVLKKIKSSGTSTKNKAERLLSDIDAVLFQDLFNDTGFIDLDKKLHATGEILEKLGITTPISKSELIEPYKKDIRDVRNKFAHVEECDGVDEDGTACKVIKDIPFTEKNCINIRKHIKKYKEILKQIEQKLDE